MILWACIERRYGILIPFPLPAEIRTPPASCLDLSASFTAHDAQSMQFIRRHVFIRRWLLAAGARGNPAVEVVADVDHPPWLSENGTVRSDWHVRYADPDSGRWL